MRTSWACRHWMHPRGPRRRARVRPVPVQQHFLSKLVPLWGRRSVGFLDTAPHSLSQCHLRIQRLLPDAQWLVCPFSRRSLGHRAEGQHLGAAKLPAWQQLSLFWQLLLRGKYAHLRQRPVLLASKAVLRLQLRLFHQRNLPNVRKLRRLKSSCPPRPKRTEKKTQMFIFPRLHKLLCTRVMKMSKSVKTAHAENSIAVIWTMSRESERA